MDSTDGEDRSGRSPRKAGSAARSLRGIARILSLAAAGIGLLAASALPAHAQPFDDRPLFGTKALMMGALAPLTEWTRVLDRLKRDPWPFDEHCEASTAGHCEIRHWDAFLASIQREDKASQLRDVNRFMNSHPYVLSRMNWGRDVYWETPLEFFWKSGQCEDYSIAKYMSLRLLGFSAASLRIVVLQDLNLGIAHAVLVVRLDGQALVLDNQIGHVVRAESIRHYRPVYSFNEEHWWIHRDIAAR